jgi:quercetin dioxygenase-like cupin family protein
MYKTATSVVSPEAAGGATAWWLLHGGAGPTTRGTLGIAQLDAGVDTPIHRHPEAEEAILVLDGAGIAMTSQGEQPLRAGTVLFAPRGSWHGLRVGDGPMRLLVAYGGVSAVADAGWEAPDGKLRDAGFHAALVDWEQPVEHSAHDPALGFFHIRARWLVDGESLASKQLVVGLSTSEASRGAHELHRHAHAAEFFYLLEGVGAHITEDGEEIPVAAGEVTFIPPGEWHGFRNRGSVDARAVFGFFGVNSREAAGYEVFDGHAVSAGEVRRA